MKPQRRSISALAIVAAAASGLALAPVVSGASAAASFCSVGTSYTGTLITWTGKGNGHTWTDASNWHPAVVPDAHHVAATYQTQYVCIGKGKGGKPAAVTIAGTKSFHIAGIDVGQSAHLTLAPGTGLFLGAAKGTSAVASSVDKHSQLQLDASTLGGNSPLTVAGTLRWTGDRVKGHRDFATQTSSECVFDPSITACPGDTTAGGGATIISAGAKMLVDGNAFGGTALTDGRVIDNAGTIKFSHEGYVVMNNGTTLVDARHSKLEFDGVGGVYRGSKGGSSPAPNIHQAGSLVRNGGGTNVVVVGVPVVFGKHKPPVKVLGGSIVLDRSTAPRAPVARAGGYGLGSCVLVNLVPCKRPAATSDAPQVALVGASRESASPKSSKISVSLVDGPKKVHGHRVIGQAIDITAPTKHTTHSTHLTFSYDITTAGLKANIKPKVYRGKHAITLCKVHGLTAINTSCVVSEGVSHSGKGIKGDLTIVLITIQPDARWLVAH